MKLCKKRRKNDRKMIFLKCLRKERREKKANVTKRNK